MHIVNAQLVWVLRLIFQQRTIIHFFLLINIILKDVTSGQLLCLNQHLVSRHQIAYHCNVVKYKSNI